MRNERRFKAKVRVNEKNGKSYASIQLPASLAKNLKKGQEFDFTIKEK